MPSLRLNTHCQATRAKMPEPNLGKEYSSPSSQRNSVSFPQTAFVKNRIMIKKP